MSIQSIKINNSEIEYIKFWTWKKNFVVIPWISLKSVLINPEFIETAFSEYTKDFTVYLFDRIKVIPENYTIEDMAEDTYKAIEESWINSCNIFWASQWWMIAQYIAIRHPNIIDKLILWSTTSKIEWNPLKIIKERIDLAKQNKIEELNKIMAKEIYCEKTLKEYWEAILKANSEVNENEINKFIKLAVSMINFNIDDKLDNIKCKTFVIGSNNDEIFWSGPSNNIAKKLNCKLYLYDDYGHWVYDEAPDYRKRILEFLNEE